MTVLFPKNPAKVKLHLLPSNADFISYRFHDGLFKLKAWLPAGSRTFVNRMQDNDKHNAFYNRHCDNCPRKESTYYYDNHSGPDGMVDWANLRLNGDCIVAYNGYSGQNCPLGHTMEYNEGTVSLSNCVIEIGLNHLGQPPRFEWVDDADNAHFCAGFVDEENDIHSTTPRMIANVYSGAAGVGGKICWGGGTTMPTNLREATLTYLSARFNNDLTRLNVVADNSTQQDLDKDANLFHENTTDKFLCSGYEALMIVDAQTDVQAFFTLLMAGFRPMEEIPHAMIIPIENSSITRGDQLFFGYTTPEDALGRKWYVTSEGFLIGQLNEAFTCVRHK